MMYSIVDSIFGPCIRKENGNDQVLLIPCDPANTDYAAYLEWVAAGNTPEPWQPDAE